MAKNGFLKRHRIVRNSIKKDLLCFALPGITVWTIELILCETHGDGYSGFWGFVWGLVKRPQTLSTVPVQRLIGLTLIIIGLSVMVVGQVTLRRNYSGTVLIREDHQLVTHGIYRFTRNPIYLGGIIVSAGLPVYTASLYGFLASLVLIPLILNRIRLEEELLTAEFPDAYQEYRKRVKKLIPFIY
ncbi:MAG: isoprenylcysteine carboxylmethyltransferase family protein [Anaerolineae bacterium]|nr:isoprenylcysteine carboxylmethyltransferase family protein [Anaerolineae bacterium]